MKGDEAKLAAKKPESFAQYSLFAKSLTLDSTTEPPSSVRESESSYAVAKIRTLHGGLDDERLSDRIRRVVVSIQAIDADGYVFVGDPATLCGNLASDVRRPLCLIWIPGKGKQVLESIESWMHVASSRLGQKLDQETTWFDAVRTAAVQAVGENVLFATAQGTTADPFICRVGKLFRIPVLRFSVLPKVLERQWIERQVFSSVDADTLRSCKPYPAFFSWLPNPSGAKSDDSGGGDGGSGDVGSGDVGSGDVGSGDVGSSDGGSSDGGSSDGGSSDGGSSDDLIQNENRVGRSDGDRLLASLATMQVLVSVRRGGNVFKAAERRLADRPATATRVLLDPELTKPNVSESLLKAGAVGWRLLPPKVSREQSKGEGQVRHVSGAVEPLEFSRVCDQEFLIHWTRRRVGPWPDLTHDEYLDDLIFRSNRRRQDARAALCRLLASRVLLGSADLTRDRRSVTCFSRMNLSELITKRVFRGHLSRWDFEPYGIAFTPAVLQREFGVGPVIYGDESTWRQVDDAERPFFQLQQSKSGKIDWRSEKEWRTLGDVDLSRIGPEDAIVFVGRESDLDVVGELSIWPVVALPQSQHNPQSGVQ